MNSTEYVTLNLVYLVKSDIQYKVSKFPDGQQTVDLILPSNVPLNINSLVVIKSRFNSFKDLELIVCTVEALRNVGFTKIHLYIPYFLGARSDRNFQPTLHEISKKILLSIQLELPVPLQQEIFKLDKTATEKTKSHATGSNYLKDVITPIINNLNLESITVMDSHSDVLEATIKHFQKIDNTLIVKYSLLDIASQNTTLPFDQYLNSKLSIVSPDAGALKKIYNVTENVGYKGNIVIASKHRGLDGKITHTEVPLTASDFEKDFIIIDDICDGGRTFIEIAKKIKEQHVLFNEGDKREIPSKYIPKIYLILTHGIFSAGYQLLNEHFDGIYCTNSVKDVPEEVTEVNNGGGTDYAVKVQTKVKQLNIF